MALDPKIASLKAAGTYRFEFDKSQVVSIPANQTRLLVGFSKKGPFNTPVFVPDTSFFKQVFGDIDRNLERKDSYFHRSCLVALERGPILALNLLSLDQTDEVNFIKLGTAATPEAQNNNGALAEYQKFFNRDKFFFPDTDAFLDNVSANRTTLSSSTTNDLLDFVNLGQNPISIIVKKAANANVASFNVTVEEFYGAANVPGFLNKDSLISDFMVDVFVLGGNFGGDFNTATPYERFNADPTFQPYFDKTLGIKRRKFDSDTTDTLLQEFFNESEVSLIAQYTACLLPDFVDLIGNNLFIENVINADSPTTGLFCTVNQDLFSGDFLIDGVAGGIDLIGHNIEYSQTSGIQDDVNFLSYHSSIVSDLSYQRTAQVTRNETIQTGSITETFVVESVANPDTGQGGAVYEIDGEIKPQLSLIRGGVYTFDVSHASNANHPLRFRVGGPGSDQFTQGVVITGTQGTAGATVVFTVPNNAPNTLQYYCTNHPLYMGNTITISTGSSVSVSVTTLSGGSIQIQVAGSTSNSFFDAFANMTANTATEVGSFIKGAISGKFIPVLSVNVTSTVVSVVVSSVGGITTADFPTQNGSVYTYINEEDINFTSQEFSAASTNSQIIGSYGSTLFSQFANGILTNGDEAVYSIGNTEYTSYLVFNAVDYGFVHTGAPTTTNNKVQISDPAFNLPVVRVTAYEEDGFVNQTPKSEFNIDSTTNYFLKSNGDDYGAHILGIQTLKGSVNQSISIIADFTTEPLLKPNQILILSTVLQAADITVGNYLLNSEGSISIPHSRLTRINQVQGGKTTSQFPVIPANTTALLVTCQSEISITEIDNVKHIELYYPIDTWVDHLNIFALDGFKLDVTKHVPNGSNDRQNEILNGTLGGTNLFKALTDRETINFRYVVDTFGNGIEAGSKSVLTNLCQTRKNAFAILNAPSSKDFKGNINPQFTDLTGSLSSRLISTGGDLSKNPTVRYSLPATTQGGSFGAFYYPNLVVRDLGKNIIVPPAAYVSNNFIAKYENALPWSLVAGVRRGVVGGTGVVGLEINLDLSDREFLEPFGLNPIVFQSGTGPTIFANKTAQQTPKSALSSINVRECVIFIQDGIDAILKNYLFEFNTAQTRLEIKTLADNFLSTVQNDDGVFDFRNIMDETNNTPDVIDNNIGILDTFIEPVRGMEILVQRTTILRTGAISSGNFQ